jgi:hypothetical protein
MIKFDKVGKNNIPEEDLGFLLWELQEFENFYPVYKTMIKKE